MSCANSVARSCSRSCARAVNARRGNSYPPTLALLWSSAKPLKSLKGVNPTYTGTPVVSAGGVVPGDGPAFTSVAIWSDGGTLVVEFTATTASADLVGDVQVFGPLYACSGGLKAMDGVNEASCAASWGVGDVVAAVMQTINGFLTVGVADAKLSRTNLATKSNTITDASWTKNGGSASGSTFEKTAGVSGSGFLLKTLTSPPTSTARITVRASAGSVNRMTIVVSDSTTFAQRGRLSCLLISDQRDYHLYLTNIDTTHNLSVIIYVGYTNTTYNGTINVHDVCFSSCADIRTEPFLGLIPNTGTSALAETFSSVDLTPWGNGVVVGDSILGGISTDFNVTFFGWIFGISGSVYLANKAVGGNLLSDIAAAFATDIDGNSAVVISGAMNSVVGLVSVSTMLSQMTGMIATARAAGKEVIVCNCGPAGGKSGWTAGLQTTLEAYNTGLAEYCSTNGVELVDMYTLLKNPASTALLAAYDQGDGLHPNSLGRQVIAEAVLGRIAPQTFSNVGGVSLFDATLPALELAPTAPGDLRSVQCWSKVASAKDIGKY